MKTTSQHTENMSNEDIIAVARNIREEDNRRLNVRPWKSRNRIAWYVAVPAACFIGFVLGYCMHLSTLGDSPENLASAVAADTFLAREVVSDTVYQTTNPHRPVRPRPITASAPSSSKPRKIGVSVLEDGIRYDLLASSPDRQMY
jgi:hypothetical protein